jgi:hypothetical protein
MQTSRARLVEKLVAVWRKEGPVAATGKVVSFTGRRIRERLSRDYHIDKRRRELSAKLNSDFNATVAYGPFKGLKLAAETWWVGGIDRSSMLLGLYEREVMESLADVPHSHRTFIDLGAADGYFGIGVLINRMFDKSYCFEASPLGQEIIRANARLNGVADKVFVHGTATKDFHLLISAEERSRAVLLVDIEGGEFDLLEEEQLLAWKDCIIIVEMHPHFVSDGAERMERFKRSASRYFDVREITMTSRDLSQFPEIASFTDSDRWLICSEGRAWLMKWYRLDPKPGAAESPAADRMTAA